MVKFWLSLSVMLVVLCAIVISAVDGSLAERAWLHLALLGSVTWFGTVLTAPDEDWRY